jgi:hypothetical protein
VRQSDPRSIVDTAICTKGLRDLAGQLLYGISLQCSNLVIDLDAELGRIVLTAATSAALRNMQLVLPNPTTVGGC